MAELSREQAENARTIIAVGRGADIPDQGIVIALMTAMQESSLLDLDSGDRGPLGLLQVPGGESMTPGAAAQAVQKSAPRTSAPSGGRSPVTCSLSTAASHRSAGAPPCCTARTTPTSRIG